MTKISQLSSIGDSLAVGDQFLIRDIDDTGTPNKSVTVSGITRALDLGTAAAPAIAFASDKNTGIYSPGADQLAVATNGAGRLFIDASGNVLLNDSASVTSNVSAYLRIRQANAAADTSIGIINAQNSDANATVKIKAGQATRNGGEIVFGRENGSDWSTTTLADGYIAFSSVLNNTNAEALRITSAGLVGIGTSAPNATLTVAGGPLVDSSFFPSGNLIGSFSSSVGDAELITFGNASLNASTFTMAFVPRRGGSTGAQNGWYQKIDSTSAAAGSYTLGTLQRAAGGGAPETPRFHITSAGLVGIGTTSPGAILHTVNTSAGAATVGAFIQNSSLTAGTEVRLGFAPNTNVVGDNRYSWIGAVNGAGSNDSSLTFATTPGGTGATERMRIDSSGRLLVGTSSSLGNGLLQVKGEVNIQQASGGADYETKLTSNAVSFTDISTTATSGLPATNGPGLYMFTIRTIGNHSGTFLVSAGIHSGSNYYYAGFGASGNVTLTNVSNGTITVVLLGDARTYTFAWDTAGSAPTFRASSTATGVTLVAVTSISTAI